MLTTGLSDPPVVTTTVFISNLHCPSCVTSIEESLNALIPPPESISHSIISHSVVVRHKASLSVNNISEALELAGFEVHSMVQNQPTSKDPMEVVDSGPYTPEWKNSLQQAVSHWRLPSGHAKDPDTLKRKRHVERCEQCRVDSEAKNGDTCSSEKLAGKVDSSTISIETDSASAGDRILKLNLPVSESFIVIDSQLSSSPYRATLALSGMTCSSCVASITQAVERLPWVRSANVNLLTSSATVDFNGKNHAEELVSIIEEIGFEANLERIDEILAPSSGKVQPKMPDKWRATYAVGGMTCSSCVGNVMNAFKEYEWVEKVDVNLLSNSATVVFLGNEHLQEIQQAIENAGYDATLDSVNPVGQGQAEVMERSISILIDGIFCRHCPPRILKVLSETYGERLQFEDPPLAEKHPILKIKYLPEPPNFTIRNIIESIVAIDPVFKPSIYHPPTIEERARDMHARERRRICFRLALSIISAVPTFIIGIVYMDLASKNNKVRKYLMQSMWAGNVSRIDWALFILATPVYFFAADTFHIRALKEIQALWRPSSRTPFFQRFYRFGSMNMLMSLGTSIAYFASIAELARAATRQSSGSLSDSYFDSVVFLTMFLLTGRLIEAYSKARTGDAVTSLGKLRPDEAILVDSTHSKDLNVSVDLLEIGDVVRVPYGTSPPYDGIVIEGTARFDESSLTGESRLVSKAAGDTVFSGTINKGGPITVQLTTISGSSMLDQIIDAVREGQTRRAPVERAADAITSHFVPFVVLVAIATWLVWLILGQSGSLPRDWRDADSGSWTLWSLRFAIALFVVACPCGIGLAAPTALFVGGGLAAKYGILVKGGGEAFQEASSLDCIVFDKTGTLTQGGDPVVTDHQVIEGQDQAFILGIVKKTEESSSHPVARALVSFCSTHQTQQPEIISIDEIPGKGLKASFNPLPAHPSLTITSAIIGNEALMSDHDVVISPSATALLSTWKSQGKSVALAAASSLPETSTYTLAALFAISDPLRPEAAGTIASLHRLGLAVWMLSGDNTTTATAVGTAVGIPASNIIAGVLPEQKAEKIRYLQRSLAKASGRRRGMFGWLTRGNEGKRATLAMLGDGINDAPALAAADVSIAIGSGSDIALASASFILVTSHLSAVLTLLALSRSVFRRVWFNFAWALVYNLIAMPVAAGAFFAIRTGGGEHVRLDPVWASLAMAASSVSVVCSSLALRTRVPGVGFRPPMAAKKEEVLNI
ncbi:heavy metal translocatin [Lepidopterella palustris CBS 459.81]|uniref:Heavy metal translocatin n=1 Tax=Lepidopterella palustris CBS 459.81 TaxID=1314670 RepID=A0A8E2EE50_9PEZI|nr:heavy metal translocatin [Lepidopterella palustris CBS 459.81]